MEKYFGSENSDLPKEMAFEIFKKLPLLEQVKSQTVCKDWKRMLRNKVMLQGLGLQSYDELKQHAGNIKSFFGRYLFTNIIKGKQGITATSSDGQLTWGLLQQLDQQFSKIDDQVKDGFDGYLCSDWAMWCYEEAAGPIMDFLTDSKDRLDFYHYCQKFDREIPRFYALSLRETYAINDEQLSVGLEAKSA